MKRKAKLFNFLDVSVIVFITSLVMFFLGGLLIYLHLGGINYSLLDNDTELQNFISEYNTLNDKFYEDLDKKAIIEGAINGMYSAVDDPYTTYLDEYNSNNLNDTLSGQYQGIGIRIETTEEYTKIVEVFDNSPAYKAGLQVGDIIRKVNDVDVVGMSGDSVANIIKSSTQTISLIINRNEEEIEVKLDTTSLMVPVVTPKLLERNNKNVGYIYLSVFNDTADIQFENALTSLENSNIDSLIIDLRYNTGGYLDVAKNITEMFLKKNKVIYSLESKNSKSTYKDQTSESREYKIAVLVNNTSASASEILAAALKYSYGATLIGEKTYGKGKVQEKSNLSNGTTVKYTTARWLTPNGDCIDGVGLAPDYIVELNAETYDSNDIYSDSQVLYALEYLVD